MRRPARCGNTGRWQFLPPGTICRPASGRSCRPWISRCPVAALQLELPPLPSRARAHAPRMARQLLATSAPVWARKEREQGPVVVTRFGRVEVDLLRIPQAASMRLGAHDSFARQLGAAVDDA